MLSNYLSAAGPNVKSIGAQELFFAVQYILLNIFGLSTIRSKLYLNIVNYTYLNYPALDGKKL